MTAPTAKVANSSRKRASNPNRGSKPGERRGGRVKGEPNKLTRTIKESIEQAFTNVGGVEYLARMAEAQPTAFMTLLGRVLPTQMEHSNPDGSMKQAPTRIVIEAAPIQISDDDLT